MNLRPRPVNRTSTTVPITSTTDVREAGRDRVEERVRSAVEPSGRRTRRAKGKVVVAEPNLESSDDEIRDTFTANENEQEEEQAGKDESNDGTPQVSRSTPSLHFRCAFRSGS